jgi:hypothetical protein
MGLSLVVIYGIMIAPHAEKWMCGDALQVKRIAAGGLDAGAARPKQQGFRAASQIAVK